MVGSSAPTVLTSLITTGREGNQFWLLWRVVIAIFHFVTNGFHQFNTWLQWTSIVSFSVDLSHIISETTPHNRPHRSEHFQMAEPFTRTQRALGALQKQFARFYGNYMSAAQTIAIVCVVLNMYQAVVGVSIRSLVVALVVGYGFVQLLEATAEVHQTSSDVLEEWRKVSRRDVPVWFPRFLKSCPCLSIPVGSFFYVDRGLILTFLSITLNNSASLILTF